MVYDPIALTFLSLSLMVVFVLGAWTKLQSMEAFEGVVYNYRLLPERAAGPVARLLPGVELAVGLGLLVAPARGYAAAGALVLLVIFTAAIGINLLRGRREIDCGCFSSTLKQKLSWWLVIRNGALIAIAGWLVHVSGQPIPTVSWLTWSIGGAAVVAFGAIYMAWGILAMGPRHGQRQSPHN